MRWIVTMALVSLALATPGSAQEAGISWAKDLAEARKTSARDGRPIILYFTFDT